MAFRFCKKLATGLALALVFTGCSSDGAPDVETSIERLDVEQADALYVELLTLRSEYVTECMKDQGFEYQAPLPEFDGSRSFASDVDTVANVGYGIAVQRLDRLERAQRQNESIADQLADPETGLAFLEALHGSGEFQGCEAAASGRVEFERPTDLAAILQYSDSQATQSLDEDVNQRLIAHPDFLALERRWSDCMDLAGYEDLESPVQAVQLVVKALSELTTNAEVGDIDAVIAFEVQVATVDTTCRSDTGYDSVIASLIDEIEGE